MQPCQWSIHAINSWGGKGRWYRRQGYCNYPPPPSPPPPPKKLIHYHCLLRHTPAKELAQDGGDTFSIRSLRGVQENSFPKHPYQLPHSVQPVLVWRHSMVGLLRVTSFMNVLSFQLDKDSCSFSLYLFVLFHSRKLKCFKSKYILSKFRTRQENSFLIILFCQTGDLITYVAFILSHRFKNIQRKVPIVHLTKEILLKL